MVADKPSAEEALKKSNMVRFKALGALDMADVDYTPLTGVFLVLEPSQLPTGAVYLTGWMA